MTRKDKIFLTTLLTVAELGVIAIAWVKHGSRFQAPSETVLTGAVLRADTDPLKQHPLADVAVTATAGARTASGQSTPSGYFSVRFAPELRPGQQVELRFNDAEYQPLEMTADKPGNQLYIARLTPLSEEANAHMANEPPAHIFQISNVQVRYSYKDQSTVGVGTLAKQFEAPNKGNVPCQDQRPCSPDGRWKATLTTLHLDAGEGNEFRNMRVSCIAGPCAFTSFDSSRLSDTHQKVTLPILNWSDSTDFLVEADQVRSMWTNVVRQLYPFLTGETMNFALPATSEGPSVEADLDGQYIVFPLGPDLILSWANCSLETGRDQSKIYRCQLKPGYTF